MIARYLWMKLAKPDPMPNEMNKAINMFFISVRLYKYKHEDLAVEELSSSQSRSCLS